MTQVFGKESRLKVNAWALLWMGESGQMLSCRVTEAGDDLDDLDYLGG